MRTRNLAIMFTDIKGYTERTAQASHAQTRSLLRTHESLVRPIIEGFDGRIIKEIGDAFLVTFTSPTSAVQCGMTIQDALHRFNHGRPTLEQIHLRVAVNVGEVLLSRGDVFGEPVNVASRVEGITPATEVYFTEAVYLTMNRNEVRSERVGSFELKGIREPVVVHRAPPLETVRNDGASGEMPAIREGVAIPREITSPHVLVLPYGGTLLANLESHWMTPTRRRALWVGGAAALALLVMALVLPDTLRTREWQRIESMIGRGETDAAVAALANAPAEGEAQRRQYFRLQAQLVERLVDRNEAVRAVGVVAQMAPTLPEDSARYVRLERQVLDALLRQGNAPLATRLVEDLKQKAGTDVEEVFRQRVALVQMLLERGRLEDVDAHITALREQDPRSPASRVLRGHLHFALAERSDRAMHLQRGLAAYREALEMELATGEDARLKTNVAAAYNPRVEEHRRAADIGAAADSLVDKFLRLRVLDALVNQLEQPDNSRDARDRLAARIQQLGGEKEVDRVKLLVQDLQSASCQGSALGTTQKLMERLRDEAGGDVRAWGAVLRVAQRHDACQPAALETLHRMVGERVGFLGPDDVRLSDALARLRNLGCRKSSRDEVDAALADLVRLGDERAVGPMLKLGSAEGECTGPVLTAVQTLLGHRVVFQSVEEARVGELLGTLRKGNCSGTARAALEDAIRAAARTGDHRLAGELLVLAGRKDGCAEAALVAARQVLKNDQLAPTCVDARWSGLRDRRCANKKDAASLKKMFDEVAAEGDPRAAGEFLLLAAKRNACSDAALGVARTLLRLDALSLTAPAPAAPPQAPTAATTP